MASKKKLGTPWSPKDVKDMRQFARAGLSAREAAKKLGRSRGSVAFKAMNERVRFRAIAQPVGPQNRLAARRRKIGMHATLRQQAAA